MKSGRKWRRIPVLECAEFFHDKEPTRYDVLSSLHWSRHDLRLFATDIRIHEVRPIERRRRSIAITRMPKSVTAPHKEGT